MQESNIIYEYITVNAFDAQLHYTLLNYWILTNNIIYYPQTILWFFKMYLSLHSICRNTILHKKSH
jgi:hypothetical protein